MKTEELKAKFKFDLIGRWTSCEGSFFNNEVWEFEANGTGRFISNSILFGPCKKEFKWRRKDLYCIELFIIELKHSEQDMWHEVHYDFSLVPSDVGVLSALVEFDKETGVNKKGFGIMEAPLSFIEDIY